MLNLNLPKNATDYTPDQKKTTIEYCQKHFSIEELRKKTGIVDAQFEILKRENEKEGRLPYDPGPLNRQTWRDLVVMRGIYEDAALALCREQLQKEKKNADKR